MADISDFQRFMSSLAADVRLGRYVSRLVDKRPEVVVLHLTVALAAAEERSQAQEQPR